MKGQKRLGFILMAIAGLAGVTSAVSLGLEIFPYQDTVSRHLRQFDGMLPTQTDTDKKDNKSPQKQANSQSDPSDRPLSPFIEVLPSPDEICAILNEHNYPPSEGFTVIQRTKQTSLDGDPIYLYQYEGFTQFCVAQPKTANHGTLLFGLSPDESTLEVAYPLVAEYTLVFGRIQFERVYPDGTRVLWFEYYAPA